MGKIGKIIRARRERLACASNRHEWPDDLPELLPDSCAFYRVDCQRGCGYSLDLVASRATKKRLQESESSMMRRLAEMLP